MRWFHVGIFALAMARWPSPLEGQTRSDPLRQFPPGSAIAQLARDFRRGRSPIASNVVGVWRATRHVTTEQFITGRAGPDRVYDDSTLLEFRLTAHNRLEALYAPVRRWTGVQRNRAGDLVFNSDDAADVALYLSCRAVGATRLVCFDLDHIGAGVGDAVAFERQPRPLGG